MAKIVAIYVLEGTIISLSCGNPKARKDRIRASKPEATPIQYLEPTYFANSVSNFFTLLPRMYHPLRSVSEKDFSKSSKKD
jgi:hypothetical protein